MRRRLAGFFSKKTWAVSKQAPLAVKIDHQVSGFTKSSGTLTLRHKLSAGTGRAVFMAFATRSPGGINTPTYNGVAVANEFVDNEIVFEVYNDYHLRFYYLNDADLPSTPGTYDVVFNTENNQTPFIAATVVGCYNVAQLTLFDYISSWVSSGVSLNSDTLTLDYDVLLDNSLVLSALITPSANLTYSVDNNFDVIADLEPDSRKFISAQRLGAPSGVAQSITYTSNLPSVFKVGGAVVVQPGPGSIVPSVRSHVLNGNAWEYRPAGFDFAPPNSYPVLLFFHGINAQGGTANNLLTVDAPTVVSEIHNNNFNEEFIVLSPYLSFAPWPPDLIHLWVQHVISNADEFKIDTSKIYLTGINMGASAISSYISNPAFITPIAGVFPFPGNSPSTWGPAYQDYSPAGMYHTILNG